MKRAITIIISLIFIATVLFIWYESLNEESSADMQTAENYAMRDYILSGKSDPPDSYSLKTVYNKITDRYTVHIQHKDTGLTKKMIVRVENGKVTGLDSDDGEGFKPVRYVTPKITEPEPGHTVIDFRETD